MDITFKTKKLKGLFNSQHKLQKEHGAAMAKVIRQRMDDLEAADNLETMRYLPGRCHELRGNLKGCFAVDLRGSFRLIFRPEGHIDRYKKPDGGIDWNRVVAIRIEEVQDYHG